MVFIQRSERCCDSKFCLKEDISTSNGAGTPFPAETNVFGPRRLSVVFSGQVSVSIGGRAVRITRRDGLRLMGAALAAPAIGRTAWAASWPSKPIQAMVPLGAGSTIDIVG